MALKDTIKQDVQGLVKQFMKFSFVGVTSTIIDFACLIFLHEVFDVPPILAAGISYLVSLAYNYWGSMRWVFVHRDDISRPQEATMFFILAAIGLGINEFFMFLGRVWCNSHGIDYSDGFYYLVAKLCADVAVSLWNFFSRRHWLDAGSQK